MIGRYLLSVLASAVMTLLAVILAPVLPALASDTGWLPSWLMWFQTPDNSVDGDAGYKSAHAPYPGLQTGWQRYINRVVWLWRNPANGFDWRVLSIETDPTDIVQVRGDSATSNIPGHDGIRMIRLWRTDLATRLQELVAWEWYYVRRWGQTSYCVRARLGWKIPAQIGKPATFVCSFNPLMGYEP